MKTIMGNEINEDTKAIFYLCDYSYRTGTIKAKIQVTGERQFDSIGMGFEIYANVPNPESQLVYDDDINVLFEKSEKLKRNMQDENWLEQLGNAM